MTLLKVNKDVSSDMIRLAGSVRVDLPRVLVDGYGQVMEKKERLPADLPEIKSLRDFGGCYLVHGRYLLHATQVRKLSFSSMVDINPLPEFAAAVDTLRKELPATQFETISGDFRDPAVYKGLRPTDASLLYEVVLHQENYVDVLKNVCDATTRYVCIAQPCLREDYFALPGGCVMLQFYDEVLKDLLRQDSFWPKEPVVDRFTTAHWMWGQTTSHLVSVMHGLGWDLQRGEVVDNVCGPAWEYSIIVFERRA